MRTRVGGLVLVLLALTLGACAGDDATVVAATTTTAKPSGPSVELVTPTNNSVWHGAVTLKMAANDFMIEPAGEVHPDAGHFHVIADHGCVATGQAIPKDADHVHFGKAQMDGKIYLEPGKHTLCLQVGDGAHMALPITDTVTVTVALKNIAEWCGAVNADLNPLYESIAGLSADFAAQQAAYANVHRLVVLLQSGLDYVDATARNNVKAELDNVDKLANAFTSAKTPAEASANARAAFGRSGIPQDTPGRTWISENCPA